MTREKLFQVGVKALITNARGQILLLDSGDWHLNHQKRHWDIPGGRIKEGHDALDTLRREVEEEIGIKKFGRPEFFTATISNFQDIPVNGRKVGLLLMVYKVRIPAGSIIKLSEEHTGYKWVSRKEAAKMLVYKYPDEFTRLLE
ncbi:NUDIX hydrolase [Candidatus Saccharibacteria bacterium]|nr:NUDIX hydrolase [Candidatus Saccharibacteria bacterium]